jgi:polysaccharide deacetylase 2 family uncharacterized protein YibQ
VAIIIDDLGYDFELARAFMGLGIPLSLSILPVAPYTEAIVFEAKNRDCELLLHLPMEPKNYPSLNPGPGALFVSMDDDEIRDITGHHLEQIPGVRGVNNHMGSCFTEKKDKMRVVLSELKRRNLFFIDSSTTGQSVGYHLARDMAIPSARRNVFLDNDLKPKAIGLQLERLLGIAKHSGGAIGIGHPNEETLATLRLYLPKLKQEVQLVHASKLVD